MNSKNKLTDNLKRLRKDYSLTQDEVADIISKDRSSVAKYESGKALPPIDILKQLAKLYRVSVDELCGISSSKQTITLHSEPDAVPKRGLQYAKLSKQEQLIVLKFRMMNEKEKSNLIEKINEITAESDTE